MAALAQPLLMLDSPTMGLYRISPEDANRLMDEWQHRLGPLRRPVDPKCYALLVDGRPVSVAMSSAICSTTVAGYRRQEVVELARLCSDPTERWATRVMLRLWRERCARAWVRRPIRAAISYSHNAMHAGHIYRMDGWEKITEDAGSSGGGTWTRKRSKEDAVSGTKTLWVWRFLDDDEAFPRR